MFAVAYKQKTKLAGKSLLDYQALIDYDDSYSFCHCRRRRLPLDSPFPFFLIVEGVNSHYVQGGPKVPTTHSWRT